MEYHSTLSALHTISSFSKEMQKKAKCAIVQQQFKPNFLSSGKIKESALWSFLPASQVDFNDGR